jgi:hypothetical protein
MHSAPYTNPGQTGTSLKSIFNYVAITILNKNFTLDPMVNMLEPGHNFTSVLILTV